MRDAQLSHIRSALGSRFQIESEIASGAYGTVFLARDVHKRPVALKVLDPQLVADTHRPRMLRELGLLSRLSHPHVLPMLEFGDVDDLLYYSTPFISGGSLKDRLKREGPLSLDETLRIAEQVAEALEYAHTHGVLHRDVRPRNVLFDASGRVLVKEFWIGRALMHAMSDRVTAVGMVMGTPNYMSPEQLAGERIIDQRSDVYALAVVICEMLTRKLPFAAETPMAVVRSKFSERQLARADLPPELPPQVAAAILRALKTSPRDRFASAQELVDACRAVAGGIIARRDGAVSTARDATSVIPRASMKGTSRRIVGPLLAALVLLGFFFGSRSLNQSAAGSSQPAPGPGPASAPTPSLPSVLLGLGVAGSLFFAAHGIWRQRQSRLAQAVRVVRRRPHDSVDRLRSALQYQYDVSHELARGGMAIVYVAKDLRYRGRKVALKVLRSELAASVASERFLEEIEITAQLTHPGILPLFDSGDADGLPFYVMPFVEGETLKTRLTRDGRLPVPDALSIARDVGGALDYAHRQKIVHRDIKPENILLHEGRATVADFGIALALDRSRERKTSLGQSIGTPEYMSPEQFWDTRNIDHRSDLYSLGCMLYEMLAGSPPYTGDPNQLATMHLHAPIPRIRAARADVSEATEAAICKALAKEREERFDSGASMIAALM